MTSDSQTAFVFAGGGSLGAIQVGMLKALAVHGIRADCTVGSSVGAINAAYYAADPSVQGLERLEEIWRGLRRGSVFRLATLHMLKAIITGRDHLVEASALRRLVERNLPGALLQNGRIACHVVATDLLQGGEVVISSGPVVDALLASAAIPGIFPPVEMDGRYLVDGGVANHTPVSVAAGLGVSRLIVLPTGYSCAHHTPPRGMVAIALHALNQIIVRQLVTDLQRLGTEIEIRVIPPLCPLDVSSYDFSRAGELIDRSTTATERWLAKGGLERGEIPHELPLHRHSH